MDNQNKDLDLRAEATLQKSGARSKYSKPAIERLGRVVDHTGGLSEPALESGDPDNRRDDLFG